MTLPPLLALAEGRRVRPRKPRRAPPPLELALHMAVADVLRRFARPDWRWSHFPAGEHRDVRTGKKLKAMGLQPGWPDFVLFDPAGRLHALELKRVGETLNDNQEAFRDWCVDHGVTHSVACTFDDAFVTLGAWGCLRVKMLPPRVFGERAAGVGG